MTFEVGEQVKVTNNDGTETYTGTIYNYNDFREPGMEYAVFLDDLNEPVFVGENQLSKVKGDVH
ncbi:hypothetical protein [Lysinibacillus sp. FSL W8-0992]|uniref:hypothetical protein n=1 Tax=Lysinibacillus sp. FSL W8-0992 TaxID=2954643 RepID=UPI0030F92063